MPILGDDAPQQGSQAVNQQIVKIPNTTMQYSMTSLQDLAANASDYTLGLIACDVSPSVEAFRAQIETALKTTIKGCAHSPRVNNMLLRVTAFSRNVKELHGWKLMPNITPDDYTDAIKIGSSTVLYDAAHEGLSVMADTAAQMVKARFGVNGIAFFITDGEDVSSGKGVHDVRNAIQRIKTDENLESLVTILIGVIDDNPKDHYAQQRSDAVRQYLANFQKEAGIDKFETIGNLTESNAAKLGGFISKSLSSTATAKGTGGPSQAVLASQNLVI